jgi:hypothetical protein
VRARFWVVCPEFFSGPHGSHAIAERKAHEVAAFGACLYPHAIVEALEKPLTEREREALRYSSREGEEWAWQ